MTDQLLPGVTVVHLGEDDRAAESLGDVPVTRVTAVDDVPESAALVVAEDVATATRLRDQGYRVVLFADLDDETAVAEAFDTGVADVVDAGARNAEAQLGERVRAQVGGERTSTGAARYDAIVETLADGVYVLDEERRFLLVNDAFAEMLGYDREDLLGERAEDIVGQAPLNIGESAQKALESGVDVTTVETTLETATGDKIPVQARLSLFPLDDGHKGRIGIVRDISERERLEQELDETLDRITDAFFALDTDWRFTYVNDRALELLERPREELLGEVVWEEFEPAVGTRFEEEYRRAMETQEATSFEEYYDPLETWFEVQAYPSETGLSVYFRDVTERKRMQEELRRERDFIRQTIQTSPTGIVVIDEGGEVVRANSRAEEIIGVSADRIPGVREESSAYRFWSVDGEELPPGELPAATVLESGEPLYDAELRVEYPDGERGWLLVNAAPIVEDGKPTHAVVTFRDITDQRRREQTLNRLNELLREFTAAKTTEEACAIGQRAAEETLQLPNPAIALYDEATGDLTLTTETDAYDADLFDSRDGLAWEAYIQNQQRTADLDDGRTVMAYPLGKHGVLLTSRTEDGFDETEQSLAAILAANLEAALDSTEREQSLRERQDQLETQNRRLERVQRVNTVIREISRTLTQASSREAIEEAVCTKLAAAEPYRFAWVGRQNAVQDAVDPVASAGVGEGYLEEVEGTLDDVAGGPIVEAIRSREPQVVNEIRDDPPFAPWSQAALKRGFRSCFCVPLNYRDTTYGVLVLFAAEPDAFTELERTVIEELGETIAYGINSLERKQALAGNRSVELEYRVRGTEGTMFELLHDADATYEFKSAVTRADGRLHLFLLFDGLSESEVQAAAQATPHIDDIQAITEHDDGTLYEATLGRGSFYGTLLDHGVVLQDITPGQNGPTVTLRAPSSVDVNEVTSRFRKQYGDVTLVARRERDEPVMTREAFESEYRDRLTERQREVLETAFHSGFFDRPRQTTGRDLAEILDVSQPTVNRHVRTAERKLFELLFDGD